MNPPNLPGISSTGDSAVEPTLDAPFHFPDGLLGFPDCRSFAVLATQRPGFFWLRSTEHAAAVFLIMDPFVYFEGYTVDLNEADAEALGAAEPSEVAILAMVTLARTPGEPPTANLQGPIALNVRTRLARQIVLPDSPFGLRCPFELKAADAA